MLHYIVYRPNGLEVKERVHLCSEHVAVWGKSLQFGTREVPNLHLKIMSHIGDSVQIQQGATKEMHSTVINNRRSDVFTTRGGVIVRISYHNFSKSQLPQARPTGCASILLLQVPNIHQDYHTSIQVPISTTAV